MKTLTLMSLVAFLPFNSLAQEETSVDWIKILSYGVGNQNNQRTLSLEEANQRQNQCIPNEFELATLTLSNNTTVDSVSIKYDYKEKILLVLRNQEVLVGAPNVVHRVQFNSPQHDPLIQVMQVGRSYGRFGFYSILAEKENNYLLKYSTFEEKKDMPGSSITTTEVYEGSKKEPEFIEKEEILLSKDQNLYLLENFKTKTLAQFEDHSDKLKNYIKHEKLKFKDEEDLIKFTSYFWSL